MLVENVIKDACTWLPDPPPFFLGSLDWFNDYADKQETWPVCLMSNATPTKPVITAAGYHNNNYDVTLFFLHSYPTNDAEDLAHDPQIGSARHTAVDSMRAMAEATLRSIMADTRLFKPSDDITNPTITTLYNFMDMNLDGVSFTLSIKLPAAITCITKHSGPKPA